MDAQDHSGHVSKSMWCGKESKKDSGRLPGVLIWFLFSEWERQNRQLWEDTYKAGKKKLVDLLGREGREVAEETDPKFGVEYGGWQNPAE